MAGDALAAAQPELTISDHNTKNENAKYLEHDESSQ